MTPLFQPFAWLSGFRTLGEDRFLACCPVHQEKTPSFRGKMSGTKLLLTCDGCHAKAGTILAAMGLTWAALFSDSRQTPADPRIVAERQRAQAEEKAFESWRMAEYCRIAWDLQDRDAILALDWSAYQGPETFDMLAGLLSDYGQCERRFEFLRHGGREEVVAVWRREI